MLGFFLQLFVNFSADSMIHSRLFNKFICLGQQARDALLLIMQLSHRNQSIALYIVEQTNFCPVNFHRFIFSRSSKTRFDFNFLFFKVLATGLSALYSDLPHRLETNSDDWFQLTKREWSENASIVQFMNSLQFCDDVIQVDLKRKRKFSTNQRNLILIFFKDFSSIDRSTSVAVHLSWISYSSSWSEYLSSKSVVIRFVLKWKRNGETWRLNSIDLLK